MRGAANGSCRSGHLAFGHGHVGQVPSPLQRMQVAVEHERQAHGDGALGTQPLRPVLFVLDGYLERPRRGGRRFGSGGRLYGHDAPRRIRVVALDSPAGERKSVDGIVACSRIPPSSRRVYGQRAYLVASVPGSFRHKGTDFFRLQGVCRRRELEDILRADALVVQCRYAKRADGQYVVAAHSDALDVVSRRQPRPGADGSVARVRNVGLGVSGPRASARIAAPPNVHVVSVNKSGRDLTRAWADGELRASHLAGGRDVLPHASRPADSVGNAVHLPHGSEEHGAGRKRGRQGTYRDCGRAIVLQHARARRTEIYFTALGIDGRKDSRSLSAGPNTPAQVLHASPEPARRAQCFARSRVRVHVAQMHFSVGHVCSRGQCLRALARPQGYVAVPPSDAQGPFSLYGSHQFV